MIALGSRDMDLYPLPLFELPIRPFSRSDGKCVSRRVAQQYSQRLLVTQCVNNTITALNDLSTSFSDDARVSVFSPLPNFFFSQRAAKSISLGQQRVLNDIIQRAVRLVGRTCDDNKLDQFNQFRKNIFSHDPNVSIFNYNKGHTQPRVPLVADTLSLPVKPGSVPLLSSLPQHASALYADVNNVLASPQLIASRRPAPAPSVFASGDEYLKVINRMRGLDMIDFTLQPRAVNGLFGIDKGDGTQRLIFDARAANNLFVDPPSVSLPTPDKIASLRTQLGAPPKLTWTISFTASSCLSSTVRSSLCLLCVLVILASQINTALTPWSFLAPLVCLWVGLTASFWLSLLTSASSNATHAFACLTASRSVRTLCLTVFVSPFTSMICRCSPLTRPCLLRFRTSTSRPWKRKVCQSRPARSCVRAARAWRLLAWSSTGPHTTSA